MKLINNLFIAINKMPIIVVKIIIINIKSNLTKN